ncbi:MAG: 4-hydroxy-tetrahydrodipicolinate synthase [Eubacteriaceae bacterium]|jgi:4-hydroxy-tetrahydrodipicolinate synthase|nr:4-hydroxy-tetrahydrodipicolinate synthase [Eubacteriaceae bacterium]
MSTLFTGSCVAMITPFKDGEVDYDGLKKLIDWHIEQGTDALLICGTTGEGATLSDEEHKQVLKVSGEYIDGRVPFLAGTGSNDTAYSVQLTQYAQDCGADMALIINPYYNKTTQKGIYTHIKTVADAVDIPIIIYNVPSRTGSNIAVDTLARLSQVKNIQAVKAASGNISQIAEVIEACGPDFDVYSGNDDQTLPIIAMGGKGVISVTANIVPKDVHEMAMACVEDNMDLARTLFRKVNVLNRAMFYETNPIPVKTAMRLMGLDTGDRRLPLVEMGEDNEKRMIEAMKQYGGLIK